MPIEPSYIGVEKKSRVDTATPKENPVVSLIDQIMCQISCCDEILISLRSKIDIVCEDLPVTSKQPSEVNKVESAPSQLERFLETILFRLVDLKENMSDTYEKIRL